MRPHTQPPLPPTHTRAPWPGDEMHLLRPCSHVLPCLPPAIIWAGMGEPCGVPPVPGKGLVHPMSPPALRSLVQTSWTRVTLTVATLAGDRHPVLAPAAAASRVAQPHTEPGPYGDSLAPWPGDSGDCPQQAPAVSSCSFLCASHQLPLPGCTPPQRNLEIVIKTRPRTPGGQKHRRPASSLRHGTLPSGD